MTPATFPVSQLPMTCAVIDLGEPDVVVWDWADGETVQVTLCITPCDKNGYVCGEEFLHVVRFRREGDQLIPVVRK